MTQINLKAAKTMLMKKDLCEFIKEMWDAYETSPFCYSWIIDYTAECFMYSIKHFLPKYIWQDWITDEEYEKIKQQHGAKCPVRDKIVNGEHTRNHDWNVCPRHMKSSILNVLGPVWAVTNTPISLASVSHTGTLSTDMTLKKQKLLNSEKYKYYFGNDSDLKLTINSSTKLQLKSGAQLYSVCQTTFTGFGADVIICDDLISADNAKKDMQILKNALTFFRGTVPTRLNNKVTGVIWHIQQRLGNGDISGMIAEDNGLKKVYSHTEIQAIASYDQTFIFPCSGRVKHIKTGDLLWTERFGDYTQLIMEVGEADFETQYNQNPKASNMNIVKEDYIHWMDDKEVDEFKFGAEFHYASHDCPVKGVETSDFHGFGESYSKANELLITDAFEKHMGYVEEKEFMQDLQLIDPAMIQIVEDKANGGALLQDLRGDIPGLADFQPGTRSKAQRLELAAVYMKNGAVRFARNENTEYLVKQLLKFPLVIHDDIVDAFSQMVIYHFTQKQMGVYTGAFSHSNIIDEDENTMNLFHDYVATINGDTIKVIAVSTDNAEDVYTVENEYIFRGVAAFEKFVNETVPAGCQIIDASVDNILSALVTDVYGMTKFIEQDRDKSIGILKAGFYKKRVLIKRNCKQTVNDIARLRVTEASREAGQDKIKTLDEGMAGCLRAYVTYSKGYSQVWF